MNPAAAIEQIRTLAALASRRGALERAAESLLTEANAHAQETARKYEEIGREIARGSRLARPRRPV